MIARRFFDSDVRSDPELVIQATDYALAYAGDFEFLVMANELAQVGPLPVPVARAVLNCMRVDPQVNARPPRLTVVSNAPPRRVRPTPAPHPRKPPVLLRLSVRTQLPFGVASHRGYKLHRVGVVTCERRQWKNLHDRPSGVPDYPWASFRVQWRCQPWAKSSWPILLAEEPADADRCVKCFED